MRTFLLRLLALAFFLLLGACAIPRPQPTAVRYDLGPLPKAQGTALPTLPPLVLAPVASPPGLESPLMMYRLAYANGQQPRPYAGSRWSAPPAELFAQRLKTRVGQSGGAVLLPSDGTLDVPVVRIALDDFTQVFDSPSQSVGRVALRVTVIQGRSLAAHRSFMRRVPAEGTDADAGARALADASDALIADIAAWLAGLTLNK
ncbi:MAG: ABC-type transport auxiliary lipoprotein family protein [Noviherbaspirillum sp.]